MLAPLVLAVALSSTSAPGPVTVALSRWAVSPAAVRSPRSSARIGVHVELCAGPSPRVRVLRPAVPVPRRQVRRVPRPHDRACPAVRPRRHGARHLVPQGRGRDWGVFGVASSADGRASFHVPAARRRLPGRVRGAPLGRVAAHELAHSLGPPLRRRPLPHERRRRRVRSVDTAQDFCDRCRKTLAGTGRQAALWFGAASSCFLIAIVRSSALGGSASAYASISASVFFRRAVSPSSSGCRRACVDDELARAVHARHGPVGRGERLVVLLRRRIETARRAGGL